MDRRGKLPITIEGSYMIYNPAQAEGAIDELIRQHETYNTEHVKVNTLKLLFDGTMNIRTACMVEPYEDTKTSGGRLFNEDQVADFLRKLNKLGFRVRVTTAHNELINDDDIPRYAELGVMANFTPWWHSGCCMAGGYEGGKKFLGDRVDKMYRSKSLWKSGATVC